MSTRMDRDAEAGLPGRRRSSRTATACTPWPCGRNDRRRGFARGSSCTWRSTRTIRPASGRTRASSPSPARRRSPTCFASPTPSAGVSPRGWSANWSRDSRSGSRCPTETSSSEAAPTWCSSRAERASRRSRRFSKACRRTTPHSVTLAYGARSDRLLIYRDAVERCASRAPTLQAVYFVEDPATSDRTRGRRGSARGPGVGRGHLAQPGAALRGGILHLGTAGDAADGVRGPARTRHLVGGHTH